MFIYVLCYMNIVNETVGPHGAKEISKDLENNKIISSLSFSIELFRIDRNEFGREGTKHIANILNRERTLKSFYLSKNKLN